MTTIQDIKENGVVAIIRGADPESIEDMAEALLEGGVRTLEITMETPNVLAAIEKLRKTYKDELIVGAGTVLDPETARSAIMAGAQFIFAPTVNPETIKMAKRYGVISIPGAMTPTEILTAYESGADVIKVFPANLFGPRYLKDIKGPLPQIPLMPTGGITVDNIKEYIDHGAVAVGVGSALVNTKNPWNNEEKEALTKRARAFTDAYQKAIK
ncbi:bifunctional 4-hydroxy-2-oxoglutarate aldolase/2-dehydro-3-deoxy-phosphogluconate aldolase [Salibacterium salarium]|uniref:Bifunctional 4-hydroxy-2-oxoglutarate aldolase/2-dehydro-3-deoxy-phosphogluconate aldolase n=1 Tax=Salibacterium salarium TaxID=284579 RepID=A0A3R9WRP0_9BACI|nr:bifunctional 4-hydroxy-2-oxoglutarate aldolase/2-dehydro-3-deoxy-phosphogluconate aldolase [Salibacterium salarium]RSL32169.1 bifunctional 4-hydroxy-2-oxoglutarate aldolase/2-dehydro-3-deoxy-phosphogluconate aldolase [Salibacterium salarium]